MPPKNRLERKKAKTKEAIFQAAVKLFLENGYDNTTVDQIVEKADVAKGTFFNYFPTKDSILFYLTEQRITQMEEILEKKIKNINSAKDKIYTLFQVFAEINEEDKEVVALSVSVVFPKLFYDANGEWERQFRFRAILTAIVKEGQEKGEFNNVFQPHYVADILMSIYYTTLFEGIGGQLDKSLTDEYNARIDIVMAGINVVK